MHNSQIVWIPGDQLDTQQRFVGMSNELTVCLRCTEKRDNIRQIFFSMIITIEKRNL